MPDSRSSCRPAYRATSRFGAMALVVGLATGCSMWRHTPEQKMAHELQALREAVPQHVSDPARAARLGEAIRGLDTDLTEFRREYTAMRDSLRTANARPDVTRAELEQLIDGYDTRRKVLRTRVLARHAEMIAATTADEWSALAKHERKALSAAME